MKIEAERFNPPPDLVKLVQESVKNIRPDPPELYRWHEPYVEAHTGRIAFDMQIVKDNVSPQARIIECGSIPLMLTAALANAGYTLTGIDIAPERYASAINALGVPIIKCDIEKELLPFESDSYDAVIFFELFEHLRINPIHTLAEVCRVLKPNGLLLLSSPNLRSLQGIKNFLFCNRAYSCCGEIFPEYEKLELLGHMGHVREYTTVEVTEFLRRVGFSCETIIYRGNYDTPFHRSVIKVFPSLRPFVTYIARKRV